MSPLSEKPALKEINAYKKKLNWGDVPTIYHMISTAIGELDGILSHGFDSAYKQLLDKRRWNQEFLSGAEDASGRTSVLNKPKIALRHFYTDKHSELHCFPIVKGQKLYKNLVNDPWSPFQSWIPEVNQRLFRVTGLVAFMTYCLESGDDADKALIAFAFQRIEELIETLRESFEVVEIKGYTIDTFYREIENKKGTAMLIDIIDAANTTSGTAPC